MPNWLSQVVALLVPRGSNDFTFLSYLFNEKYLLIFVVYFSFLH